MPDLLGATNPVPSYDAPSVRITPPVPGGDQNIQNIVDPGRVTRPDGQEGQEAQQGQTGQQGDFGAHFESNFMTFVQRLRASLELPEVFLNVLQGQTIQVSSGIRDGFAREMAQFLDFIEVDERTLPAFVEEQMQSSSRFTGPLFQLLRSAYEGSTSELTKNDILLFVRRFADYTSTPHIEDNLVRMTGEMTEALPGKWSAELTQVLSRLENSIEAGDRPEALRLLRDHVFPLVSKYVSLTHDHGLARNILSAMTLDVARYENSDEEGLLRALRRLISSDVLPKSMEELPDKELLRMLRETDYFKAARQEDGGNAFADRLAHVTHRALQGEDGAETQEAFHSIMNAVLINESVFMPLQHIMLPINWNGQLMFSEMWVDPDAGRDAEGRRRGGGDNGPVQRVLLKMDIQSLGAFDVLIQNRREGVSMLVTCPKSVAPFSGEITRSLRDILSRNGLKVEQLQVAEQRRALTVSEAFPKLFERMRGVNVKI